MPTSFFHRNALLSLRWHVRKPPLRVSLLSSRRSLDFATVPPARVARVARGFATVPAARVARVAPGFATVPLTPARFRYFLSLLFP